MLPSEKFSYLTGTSAGSSGLSAESPFRTSSGYYTYTSPPRALVHAKLKRYRNNISKPRGAHDYYNMMYDPHIFRGRATTNTAIPPGVKLGENEIENRESTAEMKNRKKRATLNNGPQNGRSRYKITTKVTTRAKGLMKMDHRQHTHVQTEQFLEDLTGDSSPEERNATVQTEFIHDLDLSKPKSRVGAISFKNGVDASTQVLPGELSNFDEEIQPVVEALVGKILQQSLLETMGEEEIAALQEQQNKFLEKRKEEEKLLKQLQEQQRTISAEKERLKAELSVGSGDFLSDQERVIVDQAIRSATLDQPSISTSYLIELLPSVINSLRQEGFLGENSNTELYPSSFLPMWQNNSSKAESEIEEDANNTPVVYRTSEDGYQSSDNKEQEDNISNSPSGQEEELESPVANEDVNTGVNEGDPIQEQSVEQTVSNSFEAKAVTTIEGDVN